MSSPRESHLNSYAERSVRSAKEDCLSRLILLGESSLRRALQQNMEHYTGSAAEKGTFAVPMKYPQHRARWHVGPIKNYALKHPDHAELSRNDFAVECCHFFSGFDCEYLGRPDTPAERSPVGTLIARILEKEPATGFEEARMRANASLARAAGKKIYRMPKVLSVEAEQAQKERLWQRFRPAQEALAA